MSWKNVKSYSYFSVLFMLCCIVCMSVRNASCIKTWIFGPDERILVKDCQTMSICHSHIKDEIKNAVCMFVPEGGIIEVPLMATSIGKDTVLVADKYRLRCDVHWNKDSISVMENYWSGTTWGEFVQFLADHNTKGKVCLTMTMESFWGKPRPCAIGTGSLIGHRYVLTARHVVVDKMGNFIDGLYCVFDYIENDYIYSHNDYPYLDFSMNSVYRVKSLCTLHEYSPVGDGESDVAVV